MALDEFHLSIDAADQVDINDELLDLADKYWPKQDDLSKKGRLYRVEILAQFLVEDPIAKREDGKPYRSPEMSRLDRSWQRVAQRYDRSTGAVYTQAVEIYETPECADGEKDGADGEERDQYRSEQFCNDITNAIEEWREE